MKDNYKFAKIANKSRRDLIESIVKNFYFIDTGIINKISEDKKRVDVTHSGLPSGLVTIKSTGIEVIWSGCANVQFEYELQVGDTVILLGTKTYNETMNNLKTPSVPAIKTKYRQENMKALPFGVQSNPFVTVMASATGLKISDRNGTTIAVDTGLLMLKNTTSGMKAELEKIYDDVNNLMTALNTFSAGICVNGNPLTTAAAFQAALTALQITLAANKSAVASLLKDS